MQNDLKKKIVEKKKKIKNLNASKPPKTAYFFFLSKQRSELKIKYPKLKSQALVKKVYEKWLELAITEKGKYHVLASNVKERYLLAQTNKKERN